MPARPARQDLSRSSHVGDRDAEHFLSFSWGMPIGPNEEGWIFVSFLTSTSTCWQWLTDVPSEGNGCPHLLAVPCLASLLQQPRHMLRPIPIRIRNVCEA